MNVEKCYHITSTNANANIINSYGDVNIKGGCVYGQYNVPAIQNLGSGTVLIDADSTTTPTGYNVRSSGKPESVIANKANGKVVVKNGVIYVDNVTSIPNAGYAISNTDGSTGTISVEGGTIDAGKAISNYSTAQEAVVISGGTINGQSHENAAYEFYTIANHSTGGIKISDNASITLKVNDKNNTSEKYKENVAVLNAAGGNVSITGGTIDLQRRGFAVKNTGSGTIDVSGGTLKSTESTAKGISNNSNGTVKVSGGTITIKSNYAIENNSTGTVEVSGGTITTSGGTAVYNGNANGTINVSGGTIEASSNAIDNTGGRVNVSGTAVISSTGTSRDTAGIVTKTTGIVSISGGSVTSKNYYGISRVSNARDTSRIYVSGGTVEGGTYAIYDQSKVAAAISLSDGTYNGQLATKNTNETNYTISGAPTFNSNTLLSASSTLLKYASETKDVSLIGAEGWNATTTENQFFNLTKDGDYGTKDFTLSNVTTPFNVNIDSINKVAGVPTSDIVSGKTPALEAADGTGYKLATIQYNSAKTAATVSTTDDVTTITSAALGSSVVTVSGAGNSKSLYIVGDATLKNITGGDDADTLKAGDAGSTLNGGAGDDSLISGAGADYFIGGDGKDTYVINGGSDTIEGYDFDNDTISLTGSNFSFPIDFTNANFDTSNIVLNLASTTGNSLTFSGVAEVSVVGGNNDTYSYKGHSGGGLDYIALYKTAANSNSISLGADYSSNFSTEGYATIDAARVTKTIKITGDDNANYIVGGTGGGTLLGGEGNDTLTASGGSTTLNGGDGNDVLQGKDDGKDTFIYTEGTDSIGNYSAADGDLISVRGVNLAEATVSKGTGTNNDLILTFDDNNALSIAGGASAGDSSAISIQSGKNVYSYTKNYYALNDKSITLMADYSNGTTPNTFDGTAEGNTNYATINAAAVTTTGGISIVGNTNNNYIIGSETKANTLDGGTKGNDTLVGGTTESDLFYYRGGKDVIENFNADNDKLSITDALIGSIKSGKATSNKLTFTINKKSDVLTFNFGDSDIESVSTGENAYLTKDGYVSGDASTLFSSAKGNITAGTGLYNGVSTVDATKVEKQGVTLTGSANGGLYKFNSSNKQKDGFTYVGGTVSISGYEGGKDRIDLGAASISSFTITNGTNDVVLTVGKNAISIAGAKGEEVLLRENNKNSKLVFKDNGVLENKAKNPTMATVSADYTASGKVKKIFAVGSSAISIQAGNNNTVIDASKAGGVSLSGGNKNDKLIGATGKADMYIYGAGKDVIQSFGSDDQISLSGTGSLEESLTSAKITKSSSNIKFKFDNKNTLTVKAEKGTTFTNGQPKINGETYTYLKNAVQDDGGTVSLTSSFGGTFKTSDATQQTIDGHLVKNNLTFVGSTRGETFIGSDENKKTTFKGGGGSDILVGGESKDTFFYAKSYTGDAEIQSFDFAKDKLKVASGKIGSISSISGGSGGIQIGMTNGQKNSSAIVGSFKITSQKTASGTDTNIDTSKVAFKANNTYYWFNKDDNVKDIDGNSVELGALITADSRVSNIDASYSVIDLNYSTNLAKSGVAVKVTGATPKPKT